MASKEQWARAYAKQAKADFATYQKLRALPDIPECHKLQFLQMACEKLVKSSLCARGSDPKSLHGSHAYIKKNLAIVLRQEAALLNWSTGEAKGAYSAAKRLAGEIEWLSPAVDREGQREDNCEYPWEAGPDVLHVPIEWTFQVSRMIADRKALNLLKLISSSIERCNAA